MLHVCLAGVLVHNAAMRCLLYASAFGETGWSWIIEKDQEGDIVHTCVHMHACGNACALISRKHKQHTHAHTHTHMYIYMYITCGCARIAHAHTQDVDLDLEQERIRLHVQTLICAHSDIGCIAMVLCV